MAVSKFTTWKGRHRLDGGVWQSRDYMKQGVIYYPTYDVYADMGNANAQPYIRLNGCQFYHMAVSDSTLKNMLPITVKMQINGEGTTYTFSSGSSINTVSNYLLDLDTNTTYNVYTVTFSSSTNIPIPKNGQEFTFNLTLTTKNGQVTTFTEQACSPQANKITGASTIYTGQVSAYTLDTAVKNDAQHRVFGTMTYHFPSNGSHASTITSYTSEYCPIGYERNEFTELRFLPLRNGASIGDKAVANTNGYNRISFGVYYYTQDLGFGEDAGVSGVYPGGDYNTNALLVTSITFPVTIVSQSGIDESLRPEFLSNNRQYSTFEQHIKKYDAAVQNHTTYELFLQYNGSKDMPSSQTPYPPYYYMNDLLKYGSWFTQYTLRITIDGVTTTETGLVGSYLYNTSFRLGRSLTESGHFEVHLTLVDSLGFESEFTESFDVLAYTDPRLTTYRARRCSQTSDGEAGAWSYDGLYYKLDDYGEYALVEWGVSITALRNKNAKSLAIKDPPILDAGGSARSIELPSYICTGYYITEANVEKSYDVLFTVKDDFNTLALSYPLNTILAIIDFLRGGEGVSLGKVAELDKTFDVHRNWLVQMPYDTMVQGYNADGSAVRLYDWFQKTFKRIQGIIDSRDWVISSGTKVYDDNSGQCIPSGYGEFYDTSRYHDITLVPNANRVAGLTFRDPITVNRNYLNFTFDVSESFAGTGWETVKYQPTIYLLSTKPTTINQSTGVPNGTILNSQKINGSLDRVGSIDDGYQFWTIYYRYGLNYYFDVSSYKGQKIYIVITCAQGGASQSGYYSFSNGYLAVSRIALSNTAVTG